MIKQLLIASAVTAMALGANAAEVTLWEGEVNLGTDWSESFAVPAADLAVLGDENAVLTFHYTLDAACTYWQFKPCSNGEGWNPLEVASELGNEWKCITVDANSTSYNLPLGATDIATVKANGLRVQGYGMTVTKITTDTEAEIDPNILWEGEYTITGWNSGAEIAAGKVKAGDILTYTFTNAGGEGGQVLLKNSAWANLLGTTKITPKDMANGEVEIGVTQEMIDNFGGKFFLQGDGGAVLTKVAKTGEFDPKDVIAYGSRVPGVQVFSVIPEGKTKIAMQFASKPEWAQLCNSSWEDMGFPYEESEDGLTRTYTITADFVTLVADKKEYVYNGDASLIKVFYPSEGSSVESVFAADNKVVNVYDLAGRVVRRNVESGAAVNGLAKGIYIVNGKKVLVK